MNSRRLVAVIGLVVSVALSTTAGAEEPKSSFEILRGDLQGIANNLTNVKMRMSNPAGAGSLTSPSGGEQTPAVACCNSNLDRIGERMRSTSQILEQLQLEFTDSKNAQGLQSLELVHREMSVVSRGLAVFKMARTADAAQQALAGLIRPFNRWREATVALEQCCSSAKAPKSRAGEPARNVASVPSE